MKNIKLVSALLLAMLLTTFISCSNNGSNKNNSSNNSQNTTENNTSTTATTKEDYEKYLTERYTHYFGDPSKAPEYDIYAEDFTFNGTTEEFLTIYNNSYNDLKMNLEAFKADLQNYVKKGTPEVDKLNATFNGTTEEFLTIYNNSYNDLKMNLEAFKADLQNYVKKGTPEVDKLNADVIAEVDKTITAVDKHNAGFVETTKDYATLAKDEVVKGLRTVGNASHNAMNDLKEMVNNAKSKLGIS